jgi:hypothetical protein
MTTDNNDLATQLAALEATVADLKAQCDMLYRKLGYPTWENHKKQARANRPTPPLPAHHDQSHGQSNKPLAS